MGCRTFIIYLLSALLVGKAYAQTLFVDDVKVKSNADSVIAPAEEELLKAPNSENGNDDTIDRINSAFTNKNASAEDSDDLSSQILDSLSTQSKSISSSEKSPEEDIFIPEGELYRLDTPTLDGSKRGGQAFVQVDKNGRMKKVSNIFLYYDNFEMSGTIANTATCNVRFNIISNLDQKINRLDVKLVWPDLTTTLSYSDVSPNTRMYYNYALIGDGCYNMGKSPNIVVNRCRVKGMTAAECANKLIWLSK